VVNDYPLAVEERRCREIAALIATDAIIYFEISIHSVSHGQMINPYQYH